MIFTGSDLHYDGCKISFSTQYPFHVYQSASAFHCKQEPSLHSCLSACLSLTCYPYGLMNSCFPVVYKSLLNSIILVLRLPQRWPGEAPSSWLSCPCIVSLFFFGEHFLLSLIMRCSRLLLYLLYPSPEISHFFEEPTSF